MSINPFNELGPRRFGFYFLLGYNAHMIFCEWVKNHKDKIHSVLEVGCGYFEYYSYFFNSMDIDYTGLDISQEIIDYRKSINPECQFICADFKKFKSPFQYDLVCGHMILNTIRTSMTGLKSLVEMTRNYGYTVIWNVKATPIDQTVLQLKDLGCKNISVTRIDTALPKEEPPYELIISWER